VLRETWLDMDGGHLVVREVSAAEWVVSWYPTDDKDPSYPGHTLDGMQIDLPRDATFEDVVEWAYQRYRERDARSLAA
jgi:hypothetical protein